MSMGVISQIGDIIIVLGGITVAVTNIYKFFAKPTSYFKNRAEQAERARISAVLDEKLPQILLDHDLETRNKYRNDRENYLQEIKTQVLAEVSGTIEEIKEININQNTTIEVLARSSRDMLREKIMALYHKGKRTKTLALYEKEALEQYYKDYKAENGNSYIDKYYNRMMKWQIIDSDDEED